MICENLILAFSRHQDEGEKYHLDLFDFFYIIITLEAEVKINISITCDLNKL